MPIQCSLVMFSSEITEIAQAIKADSISDDNPFRFIKVEPTAPLPYDCEVYHRVSNSRPPACKDFLAPYFQHESFEQSNKHLALSLILKSPRGRVFAVFFGAGGDRCLDLEKIEPRFGLETTLSLSDSGFTTVDTRRLDESSQQNVTRLSRAEKRIGSFDVHGSKLVTRVRGKSKGGIVKTASGADSFSGSIDCKIDELALKCDELLAVYESQAYSADEDKSAVLGKLSPLPRAHNQTNLLNRRLRELLYAGKIDKIEFDWPSAIRDEDRIVRFRLWQSRHRELLDSSSPDMGTLCKFLSRLGYGVPLEKVHVAGEDDRGQIVTGTYPLLKCLVAEIEEDKDTYICIEGRWYKVGRGYIQRLRDQVDRLIDLTDVLLLPTLCGDEGPYCIEISESRQWCLTDQKYYHASYDKFEHSDLVDTTNRRFICVKKGLSSHDLVYLFHQAALSAKMSRISPEFMARVHEILKRSPFGGASLPLETIEHGTFVLAVATKKQGKFSQMLFLPSLIVLNDYVEQIVGHNFKVAVCRIELVEKDREASDEASEGNEEPQK